MRDLKKKDKLVEAAGDAYGKTLMLLPLDVCSDESVKQCISSVKDRHIDILSELLLPLIKELNEIPSEATINLASHYSNVGFLTIL